MSMKHSFQGSLIWTSESVHMGKIIHRRQIIHRRPPDRPDRVACRCVPLLLPGTSHLQFSAPRAARLRCRCCGCSCPRPLLAVAEHAHTPLRAAAHAAAFVSVRGYDCVSRV